MDLLGAALGTLVSSVAMTKHSCRRVLPVEVLRGISQSWSRRREGTSPTASSWTSSSSSRRIVRKPGRVRDDDLRATLAGDHGVRRGSHRRHSLCRKALDAYSQCERHSAEGIQSDPTDEDVDARVAKGASLSSISEAKTRCELGATVETEGFGLSLAHRAVEARITLTWRWCENTARRVPCRNRCPRRRFERWGGWDAFGVG